MLGSSAMLMRSMVFGVIGFGFYRYGKKQGAVVLNIYRGGWCPYCNLELNALQQWLPEIEACGAQLVAVAPQLPDRSMDSVEKHQLEFEVLSDVGNVVSRRYGLVFILPESLRPIYRQFNLDIAGYNGDDSFELPIPATRRQW